MSWSAYSQVAGISTYRQSWVGARKQLHVPGHLQASGLMQKPVGLAQVLLQQVCFSKIFDHKSSVSSQSRFPQLFTSVMWCS